MIGKISHLTIFTEDQDKALEFYVHKLGFEIHTDAMFGGLRWLTICPKNVDDFEIALVLADEQSKHLVGKQAANQPLAAFFTDDCRKDFEAMRDRGVSFLSDPKVEEWGTGAMFEDLYGNRFYLNQPA